MAKINLKIVTPKGNFYDGVADRLDLKTTNGYIGIMAGHSDLVGNIEISKLTIINNKDKIYATIANGLLTVNKSSVTVITDAIENTKNIDIQRAKSAKLRAEQRLKTKQQQVDIKRAEYALKKAMNRIEGI